MSSIATVELTSRDRVLTAAQQLIIEHGSVDFSMRELAELSGLAKGTIYHHFPDKNAICLSVVEREILILRDRIAQASNSSNEPVERLRQVIKAFFGLQLERRFVILVALREMSGLGIELRGILLKYRDELMSPIANIIEDGISTGVFRPVNVEMTVITLLGMMQSYLTHRALIDPNAFTDSVADHTLELLLYGISNSR